MVKISTKFLIAFLVVLVLAVVLFFSLKTEETKKFSYNWGNESYYFSYPKSYTLIGEPTSITQFDKIGSDKNTLCTIYFARKYTKEAIITKGIDTLYAKELTQWQNKSSTLKNFNNLEGTYFEYNVGNQVHYSYVFKDQQKGMVGYFELGCVSGTNTNKEELNIILESF